MVEPAHCLPQMQRTRRWSRVEVLLLSAREVRSEPWVWCDVRGRELHGTANTEPCKRARSDALRQRDADGTQAVTPQHASQVPGRLDAGRASPRGHEAKQSRKVSVPHRVGHVERTRSEPFIA